jgi:hypothetical protein
MMCAYPTTPGIRDVQGNLDPYQTAYTHYWRFPYGNIPCASNDYPCQAASAIFGIAEAHGFKYTVTPATPTGQIDGQTGLPTYTLGPGRFDMIGVQRVDESWWYQPWQCYGESASQCSSTNCAPGQSCWSTPTSAPAPWTIINGYAHPPDGTDGMSADWGSLWNIQATYGPQIQHFPDGSANNVQATVHTCVEISPCFLASDGVHYVLGSPLDYLVAAEDFDPLNPPDR